MTISPLARPFPALPEVAGVRRAVATAGYKAADRADVALLEFAAGTTVAGVTTRSQCPSPEVELCRRHLAGGRARAVIVNSGNSNAFTGKRGADACAAQVQAVADALGVAAGEVFAASTGVIGVPLPTAKAVRGATAAVAGLGRASWQDVANAIRTTDTFAKAATRRCRIGGTEIRLVGFVKGSGMIAPDMATMLGFIATDATVSAAFLQQCLREANRQTFSCITVDGDTSTSDTVLAFATGAAGAPAIGSATDAGATDFAAALHEVCRELAQLVVRDGEGATRFVEICVAHAVSDASAHRIAMSIANSPLVKTAIAGGDANWGRVVMAVGKAGEPAERDRLAIAFGGIRVAADGMVVDGYDEAPVAAHLQGHEIRIDVDIGLGQGRATVWTTDLTHGYISINADYRS